MLPALFAAVIGCVTMAPLQAQQASTPAATRTDKRDAPAPQPWSSLNPAQREILAPLQKEWDAMSPRKQARMLHRSSRWATLPAEKREEIRAHIAHWQEMSPAERQQARENRRKFHQMTPQQREQLHQTFERYQNLPAAEREKLKREWRALPPGERKHGKRHYHHERPSTEPASGQSVPHTDQSR